MSDAALVACEASDTVSVPTIFFPSPQEFRGCAKGIQAWRSTDSTIDDGAGLFQLVFDADSCQRMNEVIRLYWFCQIVVAAFVVR